LPAARAVSSTRYVIIPADFVENRACRPCAAVLQIRQALPNTLGGICLGGKIQQVLIGFRTLHE
jgi:hypothetical protein